MGAWSCYAIDLWSRCAILQAATGLAVGHATRLTFGHATRTHPPSILNSSVSSRFPIPDSRFPIPDSQFPIPDSRFPIPENCQFSFSPLN
ncbi:MAG: hypothetical protein F6J98_39385 [Moorea sp. SIO4G2]|uniref:hypothetical protein n=1 Tax=unclassified Moorena TaxID=2683338 RepID=UPI0013FA363B|nr:MULTISPECIES: hypothetical protein [unclassified Moorena]NEO17481.1 hypothetical protein [Moorena sp. SIO3E8]NEO42772.1 hypothetical protein [Moorena sp. SIO4A3]NEO66128.1 hypothetical protein [Moorena sp. SIO4G2]NEQ04065.1 hypothetical protein [Moorena sp. SIO3F7]